MKLSREDLFAIGNTLLFNEILEVVENWRVGKIMHAKPINELGIEGFNSRVVKVHLEDSLNIETSVEEMNKTFKNILNEQSLNMATGTTNGKEYLTDFEEAVGYNLSEGQGVEEAYFNAFNSHLLQSAFESGIADTMYEGFTTRVQNVYNDSILGKKAATTLVKAMFTERSENFELAGKVEGHVQAEENEPIEAKTS
jgi:hypothetical protein